MSRQNVVPPKRSHEYHCLKTNALSMQCTPSYYNKISIKCVMPWQTLAPTTRSPIVWLSQYLIDNQNIKATGLFKSHISIVPREGTFGMASTQRLSLALE